MSLMSRASRHTGRTTDEAADMALMTWARLVEARRIGIERDKA